MILTPKEIKDMVDTAPEYNFLRINEHLGRNIAMLCLGGSIAYGTNLPGKGDVDLRGIYFEQPDEIIGLKPNSSSVVEKVTDTSLYSFNRYVALAMLGNPNTIEFMGVLPEHYLQIHPLIQQMVDNVDMFLSKRCILSFAGYANQQLNRLENAIARDSLAQAKKEEHIKASLENAMMYFADRYTSFENGSIVLYTDTSMKEGFDREVFMDIHLDHYPVRDLNSIMNEFTNVTRQYGKLNHRNHKKDEEHLDKHAMHLLRLYLMAFDIMEKGKVVTYRKDDREFLLEVRKGKYRRPDGTYSEEFFELRKEFANRFDYDVKHTNLPDKPDINRINDYVMEVNRKIVLGTI